MWEIVSVVVGVVGLAWGFFTYFHERSLKLQHAEIIGGLQQRSLAVRQLSGLLREIQHCTDDPGGLDRH